MAKTTTPPEAGSGVAPVGASGDPRHFFYASSDGLSLHAAVYGDAIHPWLPVVCLPGLSRTTRDFHELAVHLATHRHRPRRVVAFDYRGRGRSAWDANVARYNPLTEMTDVLDGMAALGIARAVVVGTSRGGIITMLMGVARPSALAGVVLNDIGPTIEARGLARIKSYIGRTPQPDDWNDAVKILQRLHGAQFTALGAGDWRALARMTYRDDDGRPVTDYDPVLASILDGIDFDRPMPSLWDEFRALHALPVLVLRGENSDLLSAETLAAMQADHPRLEALTIAGEGHPPLLRHATVLNRIWSFVNGVEGAVPAPEAVIPHAPQPYNLDAAADTHGKTG